MTYISEIIALMGTLAINITLALSYPGVVFLMALESMVIPLPSELVLPFAGYLAATGQFSFWLVWLASAIGSLIGSIISYSMGYWGGDKFVRNYGKYCFLDETDLTKTEELFKRRGEPVIFIARFIPVVRHLISIPAGIGKMDLKKFSIYTVAGAACWNLILIWLGYCLGQNWRLIRNYSEYFSFAIAFLLAAAAAAFIWRHAHNRNKTLPPPAA